MDAIPIQLPSADRQPVERLVDRIRAAKLQNNSADTSRLEWEIDQLVYAFYGLTLEEIHIVENGVAK